MVAMDREPGMGAGKRLNRTLAVVGCLLSFVLSASAAVTFNPSSVTIEVGEAVEVTATGGNSDYSGYTGRWTTSFSPTGKATATASRTGTKAATVTFTGSAVGTTTCTVTHQYRNSTSYTENGKITVTVVEPPPPLPPAGKELSGGLRISEICPKPQMACKTDKTKLTDAEDPNGVVAGWIELVNAGTESVDLSEYKLQVYKRGKKAKPDDFLNTLTKGQVVVRPGQRIVVYTTEGYMDGGDLMFSAPLMEEETLAFVKGELVLGAKVNPKKFPMVRLLKGQDKSATVIDTVIVPCDTPSGSSVVALDPTEDGATRRYLVSRPTPGAENTYYDCVALGPNAGPLYGVKHSVSDLDPVPPATADADYPVTLDVNPVDAANAGDAIRSVTLVYRTDVNATAFAEIAMSCTETNAERGLRWTAAVPAANLPKPGMLLQWRAKIADAAGNEWTSPAFNDKDAGYGWYGTIVDPGVGDEEGQLSATLPTLHLFAETGESNRSGSTTYYLTDLPGKSASRADKCLMNLDYDETYEYPANKDSTTKQNFRKFYPYGARIAIYDSQTSNYYDNVRIDCRGNSSDQYYKRSHGLKFSKLKPYRLAEPFTAAGGEEVTEVSKTSLHGEYNDPAMFRQRASFRFLNLAGSPAPYEHPKRVNLNGQFYQFAYETPRFGDELLEDFYGFDPRGSGYKNVGAFHAWHTDDYGYTMGTSADAGTKKKLPDDGNEKDFAELTAFMSEISAAGNVTVDATTRAVTGTDNAQLTAKVVEKFDLPAWLNYLAATRITQEGDDVWGNLGGYYDGWRLLDGTMGGTGTWRPVAWDLNCAWGQFYQCHISEGTTGGLMADADWNKCHPFYGGRGVKCYGSSSYASHYYKDNEQPNYAFEAVFQSSKFRRLFLRRLRTLMDEYLKEPGTAEDDTPIAVEMKAYRDEIQSEAVRDRALWGHLSSDTRAGGYVCCWGTTMMSADYRKSNQPDDPEWGYRDIWDNYIVPRRVHLFGTHSVTNAKKAVGYGVDLAAGIPLRQSEIAVLAPNVSIRSDVTIGAVVIENANDETIDLSGWKLTGPVKMTLPPGTVLDQRQGGRNGELYVTADRRMTVAQLELADQVIVGNGKVGEVGDAFQLKATDAAKTVIDSGVTNLSMQVRISEVQSSNDETFVDKTGQSPDWIELYNAGDVPVDLGGWGLSDKEKKPFKWTFPVGTVIAPGGYLLVIAGNGDGPLYTGFSLSSDGETLTLTDWKENTVDKATFGTIPCDASFGRRADGTETYYVSPSPGGANGGETYAEPLGEVVFSHTRGLYDAAFSLELTNGVAGARIVYTTDHSDPSATNGKTYTGPIAISGTTVVKATAIKEGHLPYRNVTAHTYIFIDQVADQTKASSVCPDTWSDNGHSTPASYTVSKSVVKTDDDRAAFVAALKAAPIVSISLGDDDLFGSKDGVYTHPESLQDKPNDERQADVEWVTGEDVFGISAGLAMHGAYSRRFDMSPKKGMKLSFSGSYGAGTLKHPVLKDGGCATEEFKKLVLRGEHNYNWTQIATSSGSLPKSERATYMCDQFFRSTQELTSGYQVHGTQVHLFLNGMYWGLYNLTDHVCDAFAATTWSDDIDLRKSYDVITHDGVRDGTADGFDAVKTLVNGGIGTKDRLDALVSCFDLVGYIDYVLIEQYLGNEDWPDNNWSVAGSRTLGVPYRYLLWDVEKSLNNVSESFWSKTSGAMGFHNSLKSSAEYKLLFADRVHRHLFNGGALATETLVARYRALAEKVRPRLFAEAARWGAYQYDYQVANKKTYGLAEWDAHLKDLTESWFPTRRDNLLSQLKSAGLYPSLDAAEFTTEDGSHAKLTCPEGATVYYTTDGTDPREAFTGSAMGDVYATDMELSVEGGGTVKARAFKDGAWSALSEIELQAPIPPFNAYLPTDNGQNWDDDANWDYGYYPNAPDAKAAIGVPEKLKKKSTYRNIHLDSSDISVARLEFTNGGKTNRVDTGDNGGGDLTLYGAIAVLDPGAAMIDLDEPNRIVLATNAEANVAAGGELILKGALAGGGYNLLKTGPGVLTLAATNVTGDVLGNLQCSEGVLAVETPLKITSVTKEDTIWLPPCVANADEAFAASLVCSDKLNKTKVGLFVPTVWGRDDGPFYGGAMVLGKMSPGAVTVYLPDDEGPVSFCGRRWSPYAAQTEDTVAIEKVTVGESEYSTFAVTVPYFGPLPPPGEPEVAYDLTLPVGATTNFSFTFRKNLRYWLVGTKFPGEVAVAELNVPSDETGAYTGYGSRSRTKTNAVTLTISVLGPGENEIYLGRQYKAKEPRYAARFRITAE